MNSSDQSPTICPSVRRALIRTQFLIWVTPTYQCITPKTNKISLLRAKMCENYKVSRNLIYLNQSFRVNVVANAKNGPKMKKNELEKSQIV